MAENITFAFPYYRARAANGSSESIAVNFTVEREGSLGGLSDDDVADAIRNFLAGISGVTTSSLSRLSITNTAL